MHTMTDMKSMRAQVVAQMDALMSEYEKLETVLQAIDGVQATEAEKDGKARFIRGVRHVNKTIVVSPDLNKAEFIRGVIRTNKDKGVTPKDIIKAGADQGVDVATNGVVYTYLNRLVKDGEVKTKGEKGSRRYYPGRA
jgi:hypothetical protein